MLAKVLSSSVLGIDAYLVEVEVDLARGLPSFTIVGLPEASVKESKERVKAAITNSGYSFPDDRITVNLAPANIKKEGVPCKSAYEPIAEMVNICVLMSSVPSSRRGSSFTFSSPPLIVSGPFAKDTAAPSR